MQITNCGRGIHKREVKGIDRFRTALPARWYGFTNLDLALGLNRAREVDIIIVTDRRIFVIDLKDWHGDIESVDGRWELNGKDMDSSPVAKVNAIARDIYILLSETMAKRSETKKLLAPRIDGLVVLSGKADRSGIAATESLKVLTVDEFLASVANDKAERSAYGRRQNSEVPDFILSLPPLSPYWGATSIVRDMLGVLRQKFSPDLPSSDEIDLKAMCVIVGKPAKYIERTFDRITVIETLGHSASLEFLVVPNIASCVLVHAPIGSSSGVAVPLGFASFDSEILERVQALVLESTVRYVRDDELRSELERGMAKPATNLDAVHPPKDHTP